MLLQHKKQNIKKTWGTEDKVNKTHTIHTTGVWHTSEIGQ